MTSNPTPQPLWPNGVPAAGHSPDGADPTLTPYPLPPGGPPSAAIVVCPGGAYRMLADQHEGDHVARWLNSLGVFAAVLKYRITPHRHPAPLNDAARAVRTVRANATHWNLDPARVGILGFSAGGHLSAMLCTHFDAGDPRAADPVDRHSSRPDLSVLLYAALNVMAPHGHLGCGHKLLGDEDTAPDDPRLHALCADLHVTPRTPPAFLFHTVDDAGVPVENSLLYAAALRAAGVPYEMHLYETGPHGVGLAPDDPALRSWPTLCAAWLARRGFGRGEQVPV